MQNLLQNHGSSSIQYKHDMHLLRLQKERNGGEHKYSTEAMITTDLFIFISIKDLLINTDSSNERASALRISTRRPKEGGHLRPKKSVRGYRNGDR